MRLVDYVARYALDRDIREGTIEQYRLTVRSLEKFLGRSPDVGDLQPEVINSWLRMIGEKCSPYTVKSKRAQLLVLWRAAADDELSPPPPRKIRRPKLPERVVRTLDAEGVRRLLAQIATTHGTIAGRPRPTYLRTLVLVTLDSALRQSDLHRLDWAQVLDAAGRLQIVQRKTGRRRWVHMSEPTMEELTSYMRGFSGSLWPMADRGAVTRDLRAAAVAAGLGRITHTDLRRSAIRSVEEQQAGAGWIFAGHESDSTTRKWYLPKDLVYDSLPRPRLT